MASGKPPEEPGRESAPRNFGVQFGVYAIVLGAFFFVFMWVDETFFSEPGSFSMPLPILCLPLYTWGGKWLFSGSFVLIGVVVLAVSLRNRHRDRPPGDSSEATQGESQS
jgi:hypothetical protein